jgi:hypothetical protein
MEVFLFHLVAERLLCLQMNTDGQVQKCIFEVLHREATNVVVVSLFVFFLFIVI